MRLLHLSIVIIGLNLLFGVSQERIISNYCTTLHECERFVNVPVVAISQSLCSALLAHVYSGEKRRSVVMSSFMPALLHTVASPLGYQAIKLGLPYPLFVLVSSCKLVPVLILSFFFTKRRAVSDYVSVLILTVGVFLYSEVSVFSGEPISGPSTSVLATGIALVLANLLLESTANVVQENAFKYVSPLQMQTDMNLWTAALLSLTLAAEYLVLGAQSSFATAAAFASRHPEFLLHAFLFSVTGALAQLFIFRCLKLYGSYTTTVVTVTRKFFSVLLSVFIFHHKLSYLQWIGVLLVMVGLLIQVFWQEAQLSVTKQGGGITAEKALEASTPLKGTARRRSARRRG
jgi:solute carrier family 35 (UDP-galactose transporter), member B1